MHRDRATRAQSAAQRAAGTRRAVRPPESIANCKRRVDDLIALHRKRWARKDHTKAPPQQVLHRFHREAIERCHRNGWLRLYRMEAAEGAAVLYCIDTARSALLQSGFDPQLEEYSLGQVLMGFAIESASARGARVFICSRVTTRTRAPGRTTFASTFDLRRVHTSALGRLRLLSSKVGSLKRSLLDGPQRHGGRVS